jgi:release factor glutamine methyltransferase
MADETWTILKVLDWTRKWFAERQIEPARLEAEVLIASALGLTRVMLYAHFDRPLDDAERDRIRGLVRRRATGEPVAYLVGEREFWSLDFEVGPGVLVPRPDTETLVEEALVELDAIDAAAGRIADVGTGSGCVAIALAHERKQLTVFALDRSPEALAIAGRNVARHGLEDRVRLRPSDLLAGLPEEARPLDLVVANLPYIPTGDLAGLPRDVRDFEPRLALDGGPDGLALVRRLVAEARSALRPGGAIALEAGFDQLDRVSAILGEAGYVDVRVRRDYGGQPRVACGRWPGGPGERA